MPILQISFALRLFPVVCERIRAAIAGHLGPLARKMP